MPLKVTVPVAEVLSACRVNVPSGVVPPIAPVIVVVPVPETKVKFSDTPPSSPSTAPVILIFPAVAAPVDKVTVKLSPIVSAAISIFVFVVVIVPAAVVAPAIEPKPPANKSASSLVFPKVTPFVFKKLQSLVILASSFKITA